MGTRTHTLRPRLRIQTRRLPRTRIPTRSCRSMAMGGHCTCALSARRKSGHLVARNVRHTVYGEWGSYIHQLAHASRLAVPNTASRRALSGAFSICGRISSRATQWEETEGTHARRLCVHGSPIEWSMAPTTCVIRPSVGVRASSGCGSSRRGQGDRGRVPTGPKRYQTNALRMRTGDGAPCRTRGVI